MSTLSNDNSSLPSHASVVVIGGGAIGCSTLYHLAKYGISDVVLLEKDKFHLVQLGTLLRKFGHYDHHGI